MRILFSVILSILFGQAVYAQIEPSVTLDPATGNYIIRYQGTEGQLIEVIFVPANKIVPEVQAIVYFEPASSLYRYEYAVKNEASSQQRLLVFILERLSTIDNVLKPNSQWSSDSYSLGTKVLIEWAHTMVDPSGLGTPYNDIAPDSSASGFSFRSAGLPFPVTAYFAGYTGPLAFPEEPPAEIENLLEPLEIFPNNTVRLNTLGPKDPPSPFLAISFLETLISYKHQAFSLGWIDNHGIVNSLDAKLDNAKKHLEKGKTTPAINVLQAFVNEVEAQKDKHVTSEAYALLKYNAEYLIAKLSE
jgi:hypothetical protein